MLQKGLVKKIWAVVCTAGAGAACTLCAFASEQVQQRGVNMMMTLDMIQTVSMIVLICVAVLVFAFYLAKAVLKRMYVAPEEDEKDKNKED